MKQRQDERAGRVWLKVQLRPDAESQYTLDVVKYWKSLRSATASVNKAIRIYYGLQTGNLEPLLTEFPMLRAMLQNGSTPALSAADLPPAPAAKPLKKREQPKTHEEDLTDFMDSLGL